MEEATRREVSRDDIREELRNFAHRSMRRELKEFGTRLQRSICDELQGLSSCVEVSEVSPRSPAAPRAMSRRTEPPEIVVHKKWDLGIAVSDEEENGRARSMLVYPTYSSPGSRPGAEPAEPQDPPPSLPGCAPSEPASPAAPSLVRSMSPPPGGERGSIATLEAGSLPGLLRAQPPASPTGLSSARSSDFCKKMSLGTSAGRVSRTSSEKRPSSRSRGRRGSWMDAQSVEIPTFLGLKSQMQRSRTKMLEMDNASSTGSTKAGAQGDLQEGGFASSRESRRSITSIDTQSLGPFASSSALSWARTSLKVAVRSSGFDWATAIMVSLNAVFIGWRTEYAAQHQTEEEPEIYHVVDVLFLLAFGFEAALRFVAEGPRSFCCGREWRWNLFDVLTVSTQIYEEIEVLSGRSGGNFSYLRIFRLRLLRLFRILRIVRVLRFVRELRTLVYSIACSLQSLVWTLILILFMLYIVGVFFTQVVLNYMRDDAARAAVEAQTTAALERHFGSLGASVISLFQAMSGGVDWHELSGPLASIHWSFQILFASYIAFAVLAMMNVVTGVFVDNAINGSKKDNENDIAVRLMDFCKSCDADGDGKLSLDELEMHLKKPAFADTLNSIGLNTIDTKNLFTLLDVDDDGEIDWEDMVLGCLRLRGPAKSVDVVTLMYDTKRSMWKLQDQVDEVLRFIQQEPHQLRAAARS